jgi:hypothetical protein
LILVENSVRSELKPNRIEVAFLSYNASMADSIESIYLAAKADPECDAYWIPIPYFERKADCTFGQMHYEGADRYGDGIECTNWREYDIEARHPDVIFTFAPYDSWNYVTSVHPAFYCERLRGLTDLLVYCPYFVLAGDVPEHFCTVAACMFAHKVILQSERMRDTYVRVFKARYGDEFGKPDDKFVALGSPKYDKIINSRREDFVLPDEWRELIGGRKVVFYNTSVGAILQGNERYLKKLKSVLDTFRGRDDAALWWRPHPLNEATYRSMRPQLLEEYERIVANYRREGFGIYDDTPDPHRAIAWTDAYYGDGSSLVPMYQATGKPVMIQNTWFTNQDGTCVLALDDLYDDGMYYWFVPLKCNALFRMDKNTWKPEFMGNFPGESLHVWRLYSAVTAYGDRLIFAPGSAEEIAEYDRSTGSFRKIPLPQPSAAHKKAHEKKRPTPYFKFIAAVQFRNLSFFIPASFPAIIRYDAVTGAIDCFDDWIEPLSAFLDYDSMLRFISYFWRDICVVGTKILAATPNGNAVLEFDTETCKSSVHEVGSKRCKYAGICFDGRSYWLAPRHDGPVVRWNPETGEYKEYENFPVGYGKTNFGLMGCAYANGFVWMLPDFGNTALKIDPVTEEISTAEEFQAECDREIEGGEYYPNKYLMIKTSKNGLLTHTGRENSLMAYDFRTRACRRERLYVPKENAGEIYSIWKRPEDCHDSGDCIYSENAYAVDLTNFVRGVAHDGGTAEAEAFRKKQKSILMKEIAHADGTSGKAIYARCREEFLGGGEGG